MVKMEMRLNGQIIDFQAVHNTIRNYNDLGCITSNHERAVEDAAAAS